jgi:hypothetical protein
LQFISLGTIALQSKRYFEELFHLGTSVLRHVKPAEEEDEDPADINRLGGVAPGPTRDLGPRRQEASAVE